MSSEINQNILNFLRRRANTEVFDIAGTKIKQLKFGSPDFVTINSFQNRKKMEVELINLLEDNGLINVDNYFENERNDEMKKVIRTIRHFLQEVM
jgi:hypothetical protein